MRRKKMSALNGNPMDTYRMSESYKKSENGFNTKAYKAWKECFETWVTPLAIDISHLEDDIAALQEELKKWKT
jgi:hypothetical protein